MRLSVDAMKPEDWAAVEAIYREGIATGDATFETATPSWDGFDAAHHPTCRLVARDGDGSVVGWAAVAPVSQRAVYSGVAEVSVYVSGEARGQRVGGRLLDRLVGESEAAGLWTLCAGVFPENAPSVALHEAAGFRLVGVQEHVGCMDGGWRDVALYERRSKAVGVA